MAEDVKYMDRLAILDTIYTLSQSQGSYGRMYRELNDLAKNDPDAYDECMSNLEAQKFSTPVDLILYLEG